MTACHEQHRPDHGRPADAARRCRSTAIRSCRRRTWRSSRPRVACSTPPIATARSARPRAPRFMTGRLPSRTGVYDNAAEFRSDIPTFAHYLRRAGYRTVLSGKMHFCGPDQLHGFEERLTTDIYPADFGWTPDWDRPHDRPSWYHNMRSVIDAGPCVRTNQMDFDDEVVFAAERAIYDHVRGSDDAPVLPRGLADPPARSVRDPAALLGPLPRRARSTCRGSSSTRQPLDAARAAAPACLRHGRMPRSPTAQVRAARRAYYGAISYVDDNVGRLLRGARGDRPRGGHGRPSSPPTTARCWASAASGTR